MRIQFFQHLYFTKFVINMINVINIQYIISLYIRFIISILVYVY